MYKDVIGFEDYFEISEFGEIKSKRTNKILKQNLHKNGYYTVATKIGGRKGKNYCFKVHILVAKAFVPNINNFPIVNHIDGNKTNNHFSNLEWCTYTHNIQHAHKMGLMNPPKGISHKDSKLSLQDVKYIRDNFIPRHAEFGARALGRKFNIRHTSILNVVRFVSYI